MRKAILVLFIGIIVFSAPNSIKTAYNISDINQHPDFSLEISEFTQNSILLEWNTGEENELTGFEIERLIDDGNYESIGFVPAFGSGADHSYRFVDTTPIAGNLQYRILKLGGTENNYINQATIFSFKPEVSFLGAKVALDKKAVVVDFELNKPTVLGIRLLSIAYKEIAAATKTFSSGENTYEFKDCTPGNLPAGACFLEFVFDGKRKLQEIIL
ncbi:MAG: hypothetical protein H6696_03210 [Deferribacteres bacterium]|nr:hypothetical protein [candidate division KSB1 bacterium]MCB9500925.1 hypothetical protein [Deferribacteres bacterium]